MHARNNTRKSDCTRKSMDIKQRAGKEKKETRQERRERMHKSK